MFRPQGSEKVHRRKNINPFLRVEKAAPQEEVMHLSGKLQEVTRRRKEQREVIHRRAAVHLPVDHIQRLPPQAVRREDHQGEQEEVHQEVQEEDRK